MKKSKWKKGKWFKDRDKEKEDLLEPGDLDESAENVEAKVETTGEPNKEAEIEIKLPDEDKSEAKPEAKKETEASKEKELYDRLIRMAADFDNYKKRVQKEKSEFLIYANERLIKEVLPILDNLERGYESMKNTTDISSTLAGVELIINQFKAMLKKEGVEAVESKGKEFDPLIHEAISQTPSNDHPPNTIVFEESKAYFLNNKLLRPAKVVVSKTLDNKEVIPDENPDQG